MSEGKRLETGTAKKAPIGVEVENKEPLQVEMAESEKPTPIKGQSGEMHLPPTTTRQEDIVVGRQAAIGRIWEYTQAIIAVSVTLAMIYTAIMQIESLVLTSAFFLITGSYFSRVNHQVIGGMGRKATDEQPYLGR